jgi:[calcium/calmodulin-dependent protein kinase] kinase
MKAATKFKRLLTRKRPQFMDNAFGESNMLSEPPEDIDSPLVRSHSDTLSDRKAVEGHLVSKGITRNIQIDTQLRAIHEVIGKDELKEIQREPLSSHSSALPSGSVLPSNDSHTSEAGTPTGILSPRSETGKGQAHDPLEDTLFLNIGSSSDTPEPLPGSPPIVSESPSAADVNVYEKAYEEEIQRILKAKTRGHRPTIYLTKRVETIARLRDHEDITDFSRSTVKEGPKLGFAALTDLAKSHIEAERKKQNSAETDNSAAEISLSNNVNKNMESTPIR